MLQLFEKITPEKIEVVRKEKEAAMKATKEKRNAVVETTFTLVTQGDMRSILHDLLATSMIGPRADAGLVI